MNLFTYGLYIHAVIVDIFPGLSRTLSFNFHDFCRTKVIFQDFPGPGIFKKKNQDFPGGVGTLIRDADTGHAFRKTDLQTATFTNTLSPLP